MKIIFKYSFKKEREQIDWFKKNQLEEPVNLVLPEGKVRRAPRENIKKKLKSIGQKWRKIEKEFFGAVRRKKLNLENNYVCYLSHYGSSGFYQSPNKLIIRIADKKDLTESNINIAHELVHLILSKNKKETNLSYIKREKLVDDFLVQRKFRKILPEYKKQKF